MNKTKIEYLDYTWSPLAMRCSPVSEGCKNCWHLRMADRLARNPMIADGRCAAYLGRILPLLDVDGREKVINARKNFRIGVQFMGDLFHENVSFSKICFVFDIMRQAHRQTFLVLTKRPHRALEFMTQAGISKQYGDLWPLDNVWFGVSAENQQTADERIPILLQIPAAVRWTSFEPMLGPIDISGWLNDRSGGQIHWIVLGGESGPKARPMHPDWARCVRDECSAAGVPFYFKQWGEWCPANQAYGVTGSLMPETDERFTWIGWDGKTNNPSSHGLIDPVMAIAKMRTKRVGHLLDGQEYRQMPRVRP